MNKNHLGPHKIQFYPWKSYKYHECKNNFTKVGKVTFWDLMNGIQVDFEPFYSNPFYLTVFYFILMNPSFYAQLLYASAIFMPDLNENCKLP